MGESAQAVEPTIEDRDNFLAICVRMASVETPGNDFAFSWWGRKAKYSKAHFEGDSSASAFPMYRSSAPASEGFLFGVTLESSRVFVKNTDARAFVCSIYC